MTFVKTNYWYEKIREENILKSGEIVEVETPMATVISLYDHIGHEIIWYGKNKLHVIIGDVNAHLEDYLLSKRTDAIGKELELLL